MLDGRRGGAVPKAVLHAEYEPLDPGIDAGDVTCQIQKELIGMESQFPTVVGLGRGRKWFGGFVSSPDDSFIRVRNPPNTSKFRAGPEVGVPRRENMGERMDGLRPFYLEVPYGVESDFDDDPQSSQGKESSTK